MIQVNLFFLEGRIFQLFLELFPVIPFSITIQVQFFPFLVIVYCTFHILRLNCPIGVQAKEYKKVIHKNHNQSFLVLQTPAAETQIHSIMKNISLIIPNYFFDYS